MKRWILLIALSSIVSTCAAQDTHEQPPSSSASDPQARVPRVRVSEAISQAFIVTKVQPKYPEEARRNHVTGAVIMKAVISPTGDVKELDLVKGDPALAAAALEAVKQWKYRPYYLNGKPVEMESQVTIRFDLSGR